jgi:hypothetical protein
MRGGITNILLIGLFGFFFQIHTVHAQKKDSLFFNNGSIIIGELIKIEKGMMSFDPDDANMLNLQSRKIKTIRAHSKIFRIETNKEQVYYAKLKPSAQSGYAQAITLDDTTDILLTDISTLYAFEQSVWKQFSGNIGLGFSYTRSSDLGRLNFDGALKYQGSKFDGSLTANSIATIDDTLFSRDRENISVNANYYFDASWFASVFLSYQRNIELGIESRFQEGIGIGNKFLTRKNMQAKALTGIVLNQEKSTEGTNSKTLVEIPFQLRYDLFQFTKPKINLQASQSLYVSLSQKGRVRNDGQLTVSWEIIDDLMLSTTYYNNFDNQPPTSNSRKFDYGIVFNISYKF